MSDQPEDGVGIEGLADLSMLELLVAFDIAEPVGDDLALTEGFRERWTAALDHLVDEDERVATLVDHFGEPPEQVRLEYRGEDERPFALIDGRSAFNWISEGALLADLAAYRAVTDERWTELDRNDRSRILKSFRVVLDTCPDCDGPVVPTEEVVESCCRDWDVIAVRCADCGTHIVELPPPTTEGDAGGSDPLPPASGGFTR